MTKYPISITPSGSLEVPIPPKYQEILQKAVAAGKQLKASETVPEKIGHNTFRKEVNISADELLLFGFVMEYSIVKVGFWNRVCKYLSEIFSNESKSRV